MRLFETTYLNNIHATLCLPRKTYFSMAASILEKYCDSFHNLLKFNISPKL